MTYHLDPSAPMALLRDCPVYTSTPLREVSVQGKSVWIKDESARMNLGAFKALGGVYAVKRLMERAGQDPTFVCASAGNHGMAVAAGANLFQARARIHLAETVPEAFSARLAAKGAEVVRSGATYEASIAAAIKDADANGAIHLADGAWEGYIEPPRLVMEGYTVIAEEMRAAFEVSGQWPSHVYVQAGVGGLAGAMAEMIRRNWTIQPEIVVVEPDAAPCLRDSVAAGRMITVPGPVSNMGRLDCKTPSLIAFDILRRAADRFVTVSDTQAVAAVEVSRQIGLPSSPSGTAGLAAALQEDAARPLIILSEGQVADD